MTTISDVAKLAGLSVSTVSRVINNSPHVSERKRSLVESAMQELGYVPLPAARQLRGSKTNTMAVTIPRIVNPFFSYLVDAIEQKLDEAGYSTLIVQTFSRPEEEITALNLLKNQQVDGVILCSIENPWSVIEDYLKYGKIVLVNEYFKENIKVPTIKADQYSGFYQATNFLFENGYQNIAYATGRKAITIMKRGENFDSDRFAGFQDSLNEHGTGFNYDWLFTGAHTAEDGKKILNEIMLLKNRPDVIIAGSDEVAMGIIQQAQERQIKIPNDLGVLGVDDQPVSANLSIPLTTIKQPVNEMGIRSAMAMLELMSGDVVEKPKVLKLKIVKRASI
ncbi:LacI family DNA-binding transcriptional regulator [Companilactobacillus sp. FL22-1]|uniref:LacI family DNA-binding transcriptional regulator n=1 Tax=Companilactobacillus sp. FL22-1 TaxID=3373892 RepID=UPI00375411C4